MAEILNMVSKSHGKIHNSQLSQKLMQRFIDSLIDSFSLFSIFADSISVHQEIE
ncbi:hypothetical protein HAX54_032764, partial [Datura stramonium]|nr:hypothetical protein [Datura stramonium]